jgi:hypothetical protein
MWYIGLNGSNIEFTWKIIILLHETLQSAADKWIKIKGEIKGDYTIIWVKKLCSF